MPRNGSGTYTLPAGNPVTTGTTISSTWANSTLSDLATAMTASISKDGQTTPTANLPMGTYKLTGLGSGSAATDSANLGQVQGGAYQLIGSISGVDTITGSLTPVITAYAAGQKFSFIAAGANTGAATININGLGAKSITKTGATALAASDIPNAAIVEIEYDGTQFQLCNLAAQTTNSISSAAVLGSGVTATTQTAGDNSTKIATTAYVDANTVHLTGNETVAGVKTLSSAPVLQQGAVFGSAPFDEPSGSAPLYGIRAWATFNGSTAGTNAPTAGGNITSITRNAAGDYTANFTTNMPDTNYSVSVIGDSNSTYKVGIMISKALGSFTFYLVNFTSTKVDGVICDITVTR